MVTVLYGLGGAGKSSFAVALGAHIAAGRSFLGAAVTKGRVFYAEFEGVGQLLTRTYAKIEAALEEDAPGTKDTLRRDFAQRHYTAEEKARWRYAEGMIPLLIEQLGHAYDVIIIDSFEAATMGDSLDAQFTTAMMMLFTQLARETNTAVILIDHSSKSNARSVYGSTKKTDFARVVINIEAAESGMSLTSQKCNVAPKPALPAIRRSETDTTLRFDPVVRIDLRKAEWGAPQNPDADKEALAHRIRDALGKNAMTRTEVYEHIQLEEGLPSSDAARKRVERAGLQHLLPPLRRGRRKGA